MTLSASLARFSPRQLWARREAQLGVALALVTTVLFGLGSVASRATYAGGTNFVLVTIFTLFCRGVFMVGYCAFWRRRLFASWTTLPMTALGAFLHAAGMATIYLAFVTIQVPLALMILYLFPLGLMLYMAARGEMPVTRKLVFLVLLSLLGLGLVLKVFDVHGEVNWIGVFWAFLSAVFVGARMYVHARLTQTRSPAVVGAENFILATGFSLLLVFWAAPVLPVTTEGFVWLVVSGLANGAASLLAFYGLSLTGAFAWGLYGKLEPVYAALFSALLLHEYLGVDQYIGMVVVLGSLILYQLDTRPRMTLSSLAGDQ